MTNKEILQEFLDNELYELFTSYELRESLYKQYEYNHNGTPINLSLNWASTDEPFEFWEIVDSYVLLSLKIENYIDETV